MTKPVWLGDEFGGVDRMRVRVPVGVSLVALSSLWIRTTDAYIDPGSGSFVFQAVIGGILAGAFAVKMFWRRLVGLFIRRDRAPES